MADIALTFALKGTAEVQAKIAEALRAMSGKAEAALYQEAEREMTESKQRVPVDLGTLKGSGFVNLPVRSADDVSVTMGYGGAASAYAIAVHEHPSEYSPPSWEGNDEINWSPAGTGPKFLENVLKESAPYLLERIAARIKV